MMTDNFEMMENEGLSADVGGLEWIDALEDLLQINLSSTGRILSFPAVLVELFHGVIIPEIVLSEDSQKIHIPDGFTIKVKKGIIH